MFVKRSQKFLGLAIVALVASFLMLTLVPGQTEQAQARNCYPLANGEIYCEPIEIYFEWWDQGCLSCPPELVIRDWLILERLNERFEQIGSLQLPSGEVAQVTLSGIREGRPQLAIFAREGTYRFALDTSFYSSERFSSRALLEAPRDYRGVNIALSGEVARRY